jgi:23S rRNA pseudouridine2605 synthase
MADEERQVARERLQKLLSRAGVTSRRKAERLILDGRVSVNGTVVRELGTRAVWGKDEIRIDGTPVASSVETVILALFKPRGCVTTLRDPQGRPSVSEFLGDLPWRVYPVGRLDYDADGLLLVTNDGELSHRLQHPRYKVAKTYEVEVEGTPDGDALGMLAGGVELEDGTAAAEVRLLTLGPKSARISLTVREGRYHLVKRMCDAVGHPVLRLRRTRIGHITLGRLRPGGKRRLTPSEVRSLRRAVGLEPGGREGGNEHRPPGPGGGWR